MLTTLEMARAEFCFYAAHIALYNGEVEPLHGHTFQVTLRVSGEPDTSGMVAEFSEIKPAMRDAVAPLRRRTLVPGQASELQITPKNDSLSITAGRKQKDSRVIITNESSAQAARRVHGVIRRAEQARGEQSPAPQRCADRFSS